jgi:23S rRNA pseudouridine2604 synthase
VKTRDVPVYGLILPSNPDFFGTRGGHDMVCPGNRTDRIVFLMTQQIRLSKLMADQGLCSRREADSFIERGWVYVDDEKITILGTKVDPNQTIRLDKRALEQQARQITILLNKPVGYVSGQPEKGYPTALSLIAHQTMFGVDRDSLRHAPVRHIGMAPAGRLDINSSGLLVLTQDGRVARQLIGADSRIEKEYLVRVRRQANNEMLELLRHGLCLDGKTLRPARVSWQNEDQLKFILTEGRKRQIRRMCEEVGLQVTALKRVRIGNIHLGNLPVGKWRYLRPNEQF